MSTISKFLPIPPDNFSTQIATTTVTTSTLSIELDDATDLGIEGVGQLFKKDANGNIIAGTIEFIHWTGKSSNTITLTNTGDRGITGSDSGAQAYSADDYFEVWVSSYYSASYGALSEHNADGTHKPAVIYDTNGNEQIKLTATASSVNEITITNAATGNAPEISATGGDTNIDLKLKGKGTGSVQLMDGNGNEVLKMGAGTASAVNEVTITNAATGNKPAISATGGDTNIGIEITPKGTGVFTVGGNTFQHGAWTSYTPTLTNVTIGSGTRAGAYAVIGKTVFYRATITLAADSSVSGQIGISLPVTAASTGQATTARFFESGVNSWVGILYFATTTRLDCFVSQVDGTYAGWKSAGTAIPFTWGTSDLISFYITYEAA